ncbi:hypothetical protein [Actinopolyspora mortivallis]|uniref:Uncharacterized protein n=1 Tax=Actinopolyspora mortivallis TaxID=33906 RepID=A0A2T0GS04_ACTMO|nr:hypothetical protein [Actinopolyspora mortivallis]PRW61902.1 hypothetical protein CEP50_18235 [Actinopolyspora mortivallis]
MTRQLSMHPTYPGVPLRSPDVAARLRAARPRSLGRVRPWLRARADTLICVTLCSGMLAAGLVMFHAVVTIGPGG